MEEKHLVFLTELGQRCSSNTHRLNDLEESNKIMLELCASVKLLAQKQDQSGEDIKELKREVSSIKEEPRRRYDLIISTIITALVSAFVTALLTGAI